MSKLEPSWKHMLSEIWLHTAALRLPSHETNKTEVITDTGVSGYLSLFGMKQNQWKYSNVLQNGFYVSDLF